MSKGEIFAEEEELSERHSMASEAGADADVSSEDATEEEGLSYSELESFHSVEEEHESVSDTSPIRRAASFSRETNVSYLNYINLFATGEDYFDSQIKYVKEFKAVEKNLEVSEDIYIQEPIEKPEKFPPQFIHDPIYLKDTIDVLIQATNTDLMATKVCSRSRKAAIYKNQDEILRSILLRWKHYSKKVIKKPNSVWHLLQKEDTWTDSELTRFIQYFYCSNCYLYKDGYWDLVLHGKHVEHYLRRRFFDDDIPIIFEFLSNNREIKYVDLCYNCITSDGLTIIGFYLTQNDSIIGLNLMNNNIKTVTDSSLKYLGQKSNVRQLRLNGNDLDKKGQQNVIRFLKYNKLALLDLNNVSMYLDSLAWLVQYVRTCTSIKVLDFSRVVGMDFYHLRSYHLALLTSDLLRFNKSLVELHMQVNEFTDSDVEQIMIGLTEHPKLKVLDLSCNHISDEGAIYIAKYLRLAKSLVALFLSHNIIKDDGARALALELPESKVTILDVAHNQIGDSGIIELLISLKKPGFFKGLFIFGNKFGPPTLKVLYQCLKENILPHENVDTHVVISDGDFQMVYNQMGMRYKPRFYRQYDSGRVGIWRWNGLVPTYFDLKRTCPMSQVEILSRHFPYPTDAAHEETCLL